MVGAPTPSDTDPTPSVWFSTNSPVPGTRVGLQRDNKCVSGFPDGTGTDEETPTTPL